jgi:hypothetical protein
MEAPQNVNVDVISEFPFAGMFSYKHHSNMDAHQYLCADIYSNLSVP